MNFIAVIVESLLLKHQLLILNRSRKKAPRLRPFDRILLGLIAMLVGPRRVLKIAVAVRPTTLLRFHRVLIRRKYQWLFSSSTRGRAGPKGLSKAQRSVVALCYRRSPCQPMERRSIPLRVDPAKESFWVMVVMDVFSRRIVGFGIEAAHIDGISVCRMFNQARYGQPLPQAPQFRS
jgi:hypothetical protein